MVYLKGPAGWLEKETKFSAEWQTTPATLSFVVGGTPLIIKYWPATAKVALFGTELSAEINNILVVTGIGEKESQPKVEATCAFWGTVPDGENPSLYVLARCPAAAKLLK